MNSGTESSGWCYTFDGYGFLLCRTKSSLNRSDNLYHYFHVFALVSQFHCFRASCFDLNMAHFLKLRQSFVRVMRQNIALPHYYMQQTVRQLSSATCPPIFIQSTGQYNGGTACSAFLLVRKENCAATKPQRFSLKWPIFNSVASRWSKLLSFVALQDGYFQGDRQKMREKLFQINNRISISCRQSNCYTIATIYQQ